MLTAIPTRCTGLCTCLEGVRHPQLNMGIELQNIAERQYKKTSTEGKLLMYNMSP